MFQLIKLLSFDKKNTHKYFQKHPFMSTIYKCLFGQILAIMMAISIIARDLIPGVSFFFLLYIGVYLLNIILSQLLITAGKEKPKKPGEAKKVPIIMFAICGAVDFLGGYFLNRAFGTMSTYLLILLSQMIYPMSIFTEILIFKTGKFSYKKIISFAAVAIACFGGNKQLDGKDFFCKPIGLLFVFLSNACYMTNTFLQGGIVPNTGPIHFLRKFSLFGVVAGMIISAAFDFKSISFYGSVLFYKEYYLNALFYFTSLALFYLLASPYIGNYGCEAFNGSIITASVYFGLYSMFTDEFNFKIFLFFIFCILADLVLISCSKIPTSNSNENEREIEMV